VEQRRRAFRPGEKRNDNVSSNNRNFSSRDGVLYDKAGTVLLEWPAGKSTANIPESVTSIDADAFSFNAFTTITIGANVEIMPSKYPSDFYAIQDWLYFRELYNANGKLAGTYTNKYADYENGYYGWSRQD